MKKSILALLLLPLMLGACDFDPSSSGENPGEETQQNQETNHHSHQHHDTEEKDDEEEIHPIEEEEENPPHEEENEEEENPPHEDEDEEEEEEENTGENEENPHENTGISLDEWKEYEFHDGHKPAYDPDWLFDYGGSENPRGCLWENPNEAVDYSGIEFKDKKQVLSSPVFNCYPKVEVRFQFWFSAHDSSKYQAADNQPQFKIEEYNSKDSLVHTDSIEIARSDVPKNNTPLEKKIYITQSSMTHFDFRFNNFVPNGGSGYTAILCKISLKGWPQA